MPLNPLNHHYAMENPASVYDEEAMTALELAGRTTAKVNETVRAFNELETQTNNHLDAQDTTIDTRMTEQDNRITKMNNETMPAKVTAEFKKNLDNGTFEGMVDTYAGELEARVNNLLGTVKEGSTTMDAEVIDGRTGSDGAVYANIGQAIREQTTNISPANLRLTGGATEKLYPTFEDGCYYVNTGVGTAPVKTANEDISTVKFTGLHSGERITFWIQNLDLLNNANTYFICLNDVGLSVITPGYNDHVSLEVKGGIYYYTVTIPEGCVELWSACLTPTKDILPNYCTREVETYGIDWLRLQKHNFPDGCVPANALSFDNYEAEEPVAISFVDGQYKSPDGTAISTIEVEDLSTIIVPHVSAGERYTIYSAGAVQVDEHNLKNFCVFETSVPGVSAINAVETPNYATFDGAYFHVTIPEGCVTLYSACMANLKNGGWVKQLKNTAVFPGLRLTPENFQGVGVPASVWKQDVLFRPFNFPGKKLGVFGDSIAYGVTSPDLAVTANSFAKLFADRAGMTMTNKAVSGSTFTHADGWAPGSIANTLVNDGGSYDAILIAGGTNDYNQNRPIGNYGDTTTATVYGSLHVMCNHLKSHYPNAVVIFVTPVNCTKSFNAEHILDDYRKPIFEMATAFGFNVVDGSQLGLPDAPGLWANTMIGEADGCHPTEAGHRLYAQALCTRLL